MAVSARFAYLLPQRPPCHCHSSAERCTCSAECLTHGEFLRKPATNPNVWPAPEWDDGTQAWWVRRPGGQGYRGSEGNLGIDSTDGLRLVSRLVKQPSPNALPEAL